MRVSPEVEIAFGLAASEAERRQHEFMSIDHLLFALLFDNDCARSFGIPAATSTPFAVSSTISSTMKCPT